MARAEKLIPIILKWETGVTIKPGEAYPAYFERCRKKGFANDPADTGGATMCGVTLAAFQAYMKEARHQAVGVTELKAISYATWLDIFKKKYWDRWQGDKIVNQAIANIVVDWVWASGAYGITRVQRLLGVKTDGQVGPKTLAALNARSPLPLWGAIKNDRLKYINEIIARRPANEKFRKGWVSRINDFKYSET